MKRKLQIDIQKMNMRAYACILIPNKDGVTRGLYNNFKFYYN